MLINWMPCYLSRSEQLLRERMRVGGSGIIKYDYCAESGSILTHGHIPQLITMTVGIYLVTMVINPSPFH